MVAASSNNPSLQYPVNMRTPKPKTISSPSPTPEAGILPSEDNSIIHLRLLAAFSKLKKDISEQQDLFGIADRSASDSGELRWTIFVAQAVTRFEVWISVLIADNRKPTLKIETASDAERMDQVMAVPPLKWSEEMLPPLDVLMILHSYMLNPHNFLQDCLRLGRVSLWKSGFPFHLISKCLSQTTLLYELAESARQEFEKRTSVTWSYTEPDDTTNISCPGCCNTYSIAWTELYPANPSEMQKGNIFLPFRMDCPGCDCRITQDSVSKSRLKYDLELLEKESIVMPGILLSNNGLISTTQPHRPVAPNAALLNKVLLNGMAQELTTNIERARRERRNLTLSSCAMNDSIISNLTEGSLRDHINGIPEMEKAFTELMKSARQMAAVYDKNTSPFSLDLVGAVLRQGVFVEKMQSFDWLHSPALNHTISRAIQRYDGFFSVMQRNPGKIAVPTFDVDLIWHTHQLSPANYYSYSVEKCNGVFIDHDDKILENVLSNSFEWTCYQFEALSGNVYDKCLCWCCALLEQTAQIPPQTTTNPPTRTRRSALKRLFTNSSKKPQTQNSPKPKQQSLQFKPKNS
jgi:Glycine-rich domain-containing protein-like